MRNALRNDASEALSRLQTVVHTLTALPIERDAPEILLAQAIAAVGADGGMLGVVKDGVFIDTVTYRGYSEQRVKSHGRLTVGSRYPLTDAVLRRQPVWICGSAERIRRYPELTCPSWPPTVVCLPLLLGSRCIGVLGLTIEHERPGFTPTERSALLTLADICAFILHRWQLGIATSALPTEPRSTAEDNLAAIMHHLTNAHTSAQVGSLIATMLPPVVGASSAFLATAGPPAVLHPDEPDHRIVLGAYAQRPLPAGTAVPATPQPEVSHVTGLELSLLEQADYFAAALAAGLRSWAVYPLRIGGTEVGLLGTVWRRPRRMTGLLHDQLTAVAAACAAVLDLISAPPF
jgi:GAF domain-containing protein